MSNKNLLGKLQIPALTQPGMAYNKGVFDQLNNTIRLFFTQVANIANAVIGTAGARFVDTPNGLFWDDDDQPLDTINVGQPVRFNQTYLDSGMSINGSTTSEITVEFPGIYNFQFTGQVRSNSGSSKIVYVWIARNGTAIGYTTREYSVTGSGKELEIAWNFSMDLQAGQHIQIMWTGNDIDLSLDAVAATSPHPGIPSAVVTVTYVSPLPETLPTPP